MENRVVNPSIALMVTAILGGLLQILSVIMSILGTGLTGLLNTIPEMAQNTDKFPPMFFVFQGVIGAIQGVIAIAVAVFILYGALKMKNLENYNLSLAASILALMPCLSPCCCLGLPFGIWAIVVLTDKNVKACFRS